MLNNPHLYKEHIRNFAVYIICILCFTMISCGKKDAPKADTAKIFETYYKLQDALFKSDPAVAKIEAQNLQKALIDVKVTDESAKGEWMSILDKAGAPSLRISESSDINLQRKDFYELSNALEDLARKFPPQNKVYKVFCPMAFGNKGATWLSGKNEVKNPYFGVEMPDCGVVKETIQ